LRAASQAEPGVLRYEVMRDLEQGDTFYMQETYADKEAFKSHARSEHMAAYLRDSAELVAAVNMHKVAPIAP
jgi:quinol monooxygenase YgiN